MRAPRAILFGNGQRHATGAVVSAIGKRVLVCTDQRFAASPAMNDILRSLSTAGVDTRVFDGVQPELPADGIAACVASLSDFKPEVIIGLGGGSCMDMAKLVSVLTTHGGPLGQYYGEFKVPGPIIPVVAIATTSGTGSSPYLIPHTAVCDPELTRTCPPGQTALSGADALTHAIEAYTAMRRRRSWGYNARSSARTSSLMRTRCTPSD